VTDARIALATCATLPGGFVDDAQLASLLEAEWAVWDDPRVDWAAYDLVVLRSVWDYTERREEFLAWAQSVPRLVNRYGLLAWNSDKLYLAELASAGLPVVPSTFLSPGEALAPPAGEYVLKPSVSAGARDTLRLGPADDERALALLSRIHAGGRTAMVQPFVGSVDERGETAVLCFDGAYSHAIAKGPVLARDAEPIDGIGQANPHVAVREPTAAERDVAEQVLAWVTERFGGVPSYARVDLVQGEDGDPLLLELEVTEPLLFLRQAEGSARRFADALRARLAAA
jgi:glutathione synthase/RimK-type ligase-like ATP-grasp enzyme